MGNEIMTQEDQHPLTANAVIARVRRIQEVMKAVMKENTHFGVIPGCQKPSLWKPGAEVLLMTFRIAPDEPKVEDLSTADAIRYRVTRTGLANGAAVAAGIGECSSDEEKYKWRFAVCKAEYDKTPEDRKREKYKRDGSTIQQVRTNPADVANTILKMADKRAYIAMTILATAASDCFSQDLEDLPPEIAEGLESGGQPAKEPIKAAEKKADAKGPAEAGVVTFVPVEVQTKTGTGDKGPWTKFGIKSPDGKVYGTFDENFGALAQDSAKDKIEITVQWFLEKGKYLSIKAMTPAANQ